MNRITSNNEGFTLIETVIALGVLGIGILAMFSMQSLGIRGNASASRISTQANWGADRIEQLIAENYDDIVTTLPAAIAGDPKYTVAWTTTNNSPLEDLKTVNITVTSVAEGKQVVLRQIIADQGAF